MITGNLIIVGSLLVFCWAVAIYDWKTLTIPNIVPLILVIGFACLSPFLFDNISDVLFQLLNFLIAFVVSFILYLVGPMGGGDVKFFTALSLFVQFDMMFVWVLSVALSGLVITLCFMIVHMAKLVRGEAKSIKESYSVVRNVEIPYGPAITLGTTMLPVLFV